MGKTMGAAEFKAHCLRILDEVQRSGESVTITKRGKPVAEVKPVAEESRSKSLFGALKGTVTFAPDFDPGEPADPDWEQVWDANNPPELYSKQ
ncbi:MAG TPA: type II toxin-antitoxin system prevent-host-death family antitoxin [Allosphingosinicella sp.]|jgi:prevent-host-death family protein